MAELLPNGNLVMRYSHNNDSPSGFLWQRFDFPTDTLLPDMKLGYDHKTGRNRFLTAWRSFDDPSSGDFTYKFDVRRGLPELFLKKNYVEMERSGPWNGIEFSGIPEEGRNHPVYGYTENRFDPMNRQQWDLGEGSDGCVRRTPLSCSGNRFLMIRKMKLPDAKMAIADRIIDLKKCEERCLSDCNCTSFAVADVRRGGTGCFIWTGELYDTRTYSFAGQDLYVKVATVDLVLSSDEERVRNGKIIRWSIGVSLMLILSVIVFCFWKRRQKQAKSAETPIVKKQVLMNLMVLPRQRNLSGDNQVEDLEVPLIEFEDVLIATEHFSDCNKVGKGGFGVVYKGRLLDGQEIAVKRLSEMSAQGTNEFINEVRLIGRLQHINLVQLLGCCVDEGEKILIYEYLENLSLDSHLFVLSRRCMLNWQMRFDIINGIARGILYLHHDSSIRIIHRDLKASNILLDKDMTPKISDFGMARIFGRDETEANTRKVVGTYGYMSPEYALDGIFSIKSDIYSFGVLLLEIISGKRNKGFYYSGRDHNLLECVWRNWKEGQGIEIVDTVIIDSSSPTFRPREILRCLQIALLCVQARVEDRPLKSSVVLMLGSEAEDIPQPKPPGYCVIGNFSETYSTWSKQPDNDSCTVNQITMSIIDAR
uniref:non-specific serine/threonine protein kinase n=1 Tax=Brassica campestris TaxID=3711 RepID=M4CBQ0_BRACM